jgi:hypothetical protein
MVIARRRRRRRARAKTAAVEEDARTEREATHCRTIIAAKTTPTRRF